MASSGVKVCDEAFALFNEMKLRRTNNRSVILWIKDGKVSIKECQEKCQKNDDVSPDVQQKEEFDKCVGYLPADGCRFVLLDLLCPTCSGSQKEVLFLISWCPDTAGVKDKLLYAATRNEVERKLSEGTKIVQANDLSDLEYDCLIKMADKKV